MDNVRIPVTAWNDGGNGYGLRLSPHLRDIFFSKKWNFIILHIDESNEMIKINLSDCFWHKCSELRSKDIRKWLFENKLAPWKKYEPPNFYLTKIKENNFQLIIPK